MTKTVDFDINPYLQNLYKSPSNSHKGQNGKLLVVGGSHLFHAASLWALKIASRVVDMVFYCSVPENNAIVEECKKEFRDGIVVPRNDLDHYIKEADCILIGPGMVRQEKILTNTNQPARHASQGDAGGYYPMPSNTNKNRIRVNPLAIRVNPNDGNQTSENKSENQQLSLMQINSLQDEGQQTYELTKYILTNHPNKKFVLDAGALQELKLEWLEDLKETPILTPHEKELEMLAKNNNVSVENLIRRDNPRVVPTNIIILLKGSTDRIYSPSSAPIEIPGGVPGMTKGGTGDVLAGLIASFYCKNDALESAVLASFFNKKAGEELASSVGDYFNASDLVDQLPKTIHKYLPNLAVIPAKAGI